MPNGGKKSSPSSRKETAMNRLREQLRRKREALADHFDYLIYLAFVFKDKKKSPALFKVDDVTPIMTNNYKDNIMQGVKDNAYGLETYYELLDKDIVQLHATTYQSMRKDVLGCTQRVDFLLWPRNDIDKVECHLFSRWKGEESCEFRPVQMLFDCHHSDYEKQILRLITRKDSKGLIITNPTESMYLFVNRNRLQTPNNKAMYFNISNFCLHVPQDLLTNWGSESVDMILQQYQQE